MGNAIKERVIWVDLVKAIAMFLVVFGHVNTVADFGYPEQVVYTFHMPLFFIVAGMFLKPLDKYSPKIWWEKCIKKNLILLMIPFFIWTFIFCKDYLQYYNVFYFSWLSIKASTTYTCYWFLPCLFIARMLCFGMFNLANVLKANKKVVAVIAMVALMTVGLCVPHNNLTGQIGIFGDADVACMAASFMLFGYLVMPLLKKLANVKVWILIPIFVVTLAAFIFCLQFMDYSNQEYNYMMICNAQVGTIPMFIGESLIGSFMTMTFAMILAKWLKPGSLLAWLGANTIGIYVVHKVFAESFWTIFKSFNLQLPVVLGMFVTAIVAFSVSSILCFLINKYAPALLGRFPKKAIKNA